MQLFLSQIISLWVTKLFLTMIWILLVTKQAPSVGDETHLIFFMTFHFAYHLNTLQLWYRWNAFAIYQHWRWVTHICVSNLTIIGSDNGLSPGRRQVIIWTKMNIVYWALVNKLQWTLNRNLYISIQGNAFENVAWKMVAILSQPKYVNYMSPSSVTHSGLKHWLHHWGMEVWTAWKLTQWGSDKMVAISQMIFSNSFSCMKTFEFQIKFHWSL